MHTAGELLNRIEEEINETERRLSFWRQQESLQAGTDLAAHIRLIVDGYDRQLGHLEEARKLIQL